MSLRYLIFLAFILFASSTSFAYDVEGVRFTGWTDCSDNEGIDKMSDNTVILHPSYGSKDLYKLVYDLSASCKVDGQQVFSIQGGYIKLESDSLAFDFLDRFLLANRNVEPIRITRKTNSLSLSGQGSWDEHQHIDYPNEVNLEITGLSENPPFHKNAEVKLNFVSNYAEGSEESYFWKCDQLLLRLPH